MCRYPGGRPRLAATGRAAHTQQHDDDAPRRRADPGDSLFQASGEPIGTGCGDAVELGAAAGVDGMTWAAIQRLSPRRLRPPPVDVRYLKKIERASEHFHKGLL